MENGNFMRRKEYFEGNAIGHKNVVARQPKQLFPQETDWTCSVACLRTMLSGLVREVPGEEELVEKYGLTPGPWYSQDIKKLGMLEDYDAIYGCDCRDTDFDRILNYMEDGYYVMVESMYNYAHWMVLLGYYPLEQANVEKSRLLVYDPWFDQVRLLIADEFLSMWVDGECTKNNIRHDFIAIRKKFLDN